MAKASIALTELAEKGPDVDLVRLIAFKEHRLMILYWNDVVRCYGKDGLVWKTGLYLAQEFPEFCYLGRGDVHAVEFRIENEKLILQLPADHQSATDASLQIRLSIDSGKPD